MSDQYEVKKRVVVGIGKNDYEEIGYHGEYQGDVHYDVHDERVLHDQDSDSFHRVHDVRTTRVHSDASHWYDGYSCLWIGIFVFITFLVFIFVAGLGASSHNHEYYGPGYPSPHPVMLTGNNVRGEGACSIGESFSRRYEQCLPSELYPSAVDRSIQDLKISPCDNFEKFSCGKWADDPNHQGESRSFSYIDRQNQFDVKSIILDSKIQGVHPFYQSCVETLVEGRHSLETKEERNHELERVLGSFKSIGDLPDVFGRLMKNAYTAPISLQIENHPLKPKLVPMFRFDGFPSDLDDETMLDLFMANTKTRYEARGKLKILKEALNILQKNRPEEMNDYIAYAKGDGLKNDMITWATFKKLAFGGKFQWNRLLERLDGHQLRFDENQEVWVFGRKHFSETNLAAVSYHQWRIYIEFSVLYHTESFFPALPSNVFYRNAHPLLRNYRYTKMERLHRSKNKKRFSGSGVTKLDCIRATQFLLPGLVSKEFLKRGFHDEEALDRVKRVVEDVKNELADMQNETPYIDEHTRKAIVKKTRSITVRVAHPTRWSAEPFSISITKDRYLRNLDMIREYRVQRDLELWKNNGELHRDEAARFQGPLSTTNAWYSPVYNVITIYPGILRYPFFHPKFNYASLFAGIGTVAGHEFGHNGDSNGVCFDEDGSVKDLWSANSERQLHKQFTCIEKEYDNTPASCKQDNYGKQVLGEAAADRTGIEVAYRAWEKRFPGGKATKEQAKDFFGSYAQTWCSSYSLDEKCNRIKNDVHPLASERIIKTLRNFQKFQWAYSCKNDAPMVHSPTCVVYGKDAIPAV